MQGISTAVCRLLLGSVLAWLAAGAGASSAGATHGDLAALSPVARELVRWVHASGDAMGRPFAIVDKQRARLHVFDVDGVLVGSSPALLGATLGDHIVEGVGERAQRAAVQAHERTTPAGRFHAEPGRNLAGEPVVWVDYDSAFAIHRLRPGPAKPAREARLKGPATSPAAMRVSEGCVVVPVEFYEAVVDVVLGRSRGMVYVLPETRPARELFSRL